MSITVGSTAQHTCITHEDTSPSETGRTCHLYTYIMCIVRSMLVSNRSTRGQRYGCVYCLGHPEFSTAPSLRMYGYSSYGKCFIAKQWCPVLSSVREVPWLSFVSVDLAITFLTDTFTCLTITFLSIPSTPENE